MIPNFISVETIREKIVPIFENYPINKAILFGSYAKGNATISSDIGKRQTLPTCAKLDFYCKLFSETLQYSGMFSDHGSRESNTY